MIPKDMAVSDPREAIAAELLRLADAFPVGHDMRRLCRHAAALLEEAQRETERAEREAFDKGRAHALLHLASATRKVLSPELVRLVEAEMRRGLMAQHMAPTPSVEEIRVGICTGRPARPHLEIQWWGQYTICTVCHGSLRYLTASEIKAHYDKEPPPNWPEKMIGYKPQPPTGDAP